MDINTRIHRKLRVGIINDTATSNHFGCVAVMSTIEENITAFGAEIVFSWPVDYDWRNNKDFLIKAGVDVIIVNGEGSIHHTETRKKAMYLCEIATFAKRELHIDCHLINATINSTCANANEHLRYYTTIWVRETASQAYLAQEDIASEVVPDLSIYSPFLPLPVVGSGPVIVTDSVLPAISILLENMSSRNRLQFVRMENPIAPHFYHRAWVKLRKACENPKEFSSYNKHTNSRDFQSFVEEISLSRGVVTGRFHSVMLSIAMRTPFLALESNTPKISSVVSDVFGNTSRILIAEDLQDTRHRSLIKDFSYSKTESEDLNKFVNSGRQKMLRMFSIILTQTQGI